jgi:hypothetical protein
MKQRKNLRVFLLFTAAVKPETERGRRKKNKRRKEKEGGMAACA